MRSSRLEYTKKIEDSIIEHAKNLFKLKKEIDDSTIKYVGNLFRLKKKKKNDTTVKDIRKFFRLRKGNKATKNRIISDIWNFFEHEEQDYYKPLNEQTILHHYIINAII